MNDRTRHLETALVLLGSVSAVATLVLTVQALTTNAWSNVVRLCFLTFALVSSGRLVSRPSASSTDQVWRLPAHLPLALVPIAFTVALLLRLEELQRGLLDLFVLGTLWSLILLQCVSSPMNRVNRLFILAESTSVALFSLFGVNLLYPVFNGGRDFLFHAQAASNLMTTNAIQYESLYGYFPILRVLTAQFAMITGLPIPMSLALVGGLSIAGTIPVVNKLGHFFTGNERAALLATVLFASSSDFIRWGTYAAPTTVGFVFVLFAIAQVLSPDHRLRRRGIALVFLGAVTLTHILAAGLFVLTLGAIAVSALVRNRLTGNRARADLRVLSFGLLAGVVIVGYWMIVAFVVLRNYVVLVAFAFEPLAPLSASPGATGPIPVILGLGTVVIASLYLVSLLVFALGRCRPTAAVHWNLIAASLVFVLGLVPALAATSVYGLFSLALFRWTLFGLPFVTVLLSGLYLVVGKGLWQKIMVGLLVIAILFGLSSVAFDAHSTLAGNQYGTPTDFFSTSEVSSNGFLTRYAHGPVVTDFTFSALLLYHYPNYPGGPVFSTFESLLDTKGYLVIRSGELTQRGLQFVSVANGLVTQVTVDSNLVAREIQSTSQVFDNGQVQVVIRG